VPGAPTALRTLLAPVHGRLLPPIRSENIGPERFAQHGHSLGLTHQAVRPRAREASFFPRLHSNIAVPVWPPWLCLHRPRLHHLAASSAVLRLPTG
jgi:hypothetical protein